MPDNHPLEDHLPEQPLGSTIGLNASAIESYSLTIMTERNKALAATVYRPNTDVNSVKKAIMIAPATGIKQQFYHNFAKFLAEQGFGVITFDNEGISDSLSTTLAKCDA
ncbi:hypothetical protein [Psychrobacter sp. BF1]|nr:hypothetical protein [Psychrobacter sp. BF1]